MSAVNAMASNFSGQLKTIQENIASVQKQLASGKKSLNAGESGQITRLSAQVIGYNQAIKNIGQAQNIIGISQTALSSIASLLSEMQQIAIQASSAGLQASDRTTLNDTFQSLLTQASSQVKNASLNGTNLLDSGTGSDLIIQSGNASNETTTLINLGIDRLFSTLNQSVGPSNTAINSGLTALYDAAAATYIHGYSQLSYFRTQITAMTGTDPVTLAVQAATPMGATIRAAASEASGVPVETISGVFLVESSVYTATDLNAAKAAVAALTGTDHATLAAQAAARANNATADSIIAIAREASLPKISVISREDATAACTALSVAINTVSAGQSTMLANSKGLSAIAKCNASLSGSLQSTISSIEDLDQVKLQAQLQSLNNQQSIGYYLVSQINSSASAILALFR